MTRWTWAAYALAAVLVLGVAVCMWGVPLPLSDHRALVVDLGSHEDAPDEKG